jgi:hypothetical protein
MRFDYGWGCGERTIDRESYGVGLNSPGEKQYDEDDDKETCTSAGIMIAGTETVATTADKQQNEQDEEKIHGRGMCECLRVNRGLERKRMSW